MLRENSGHHFFNSGPIWDRAAIRCGCLLSCWQGNPTRWWSQHPQDSLKEMITSVLLRNLKQWPPFTLSQLRSDEDIKATVIREVIPIATEMECVTGVLLMAGSELSRYRGGLGQGSGEP